MSYEQVGGAVTHSTFQNRVIGAVYDLGSQIIAAATASGAIKDDGNNDLTTTNCQNWCKNYMKGTTVATTQIIAGYMLLNATLAGDPFNTARTGTDAAMNWQLKHVLLQLVALG